MQKQSTKNLVINVKLWVKVPGENNNQKIKRLMIYSRL